MLRTAVRTAVARTFDRTVAHAVCKGPSAVGVTEFAHPLSLGDRQRENPGAASQAEPQLWPLRQGRGSVAQEVMTAAPAF